MATSRTGSLFVGFAAKLSKVVKVVQSCTRFAPFLFGSRLVLVENGGHKTESLKLILCVVPDSIQKSIFLFFFFFFYAAKRVRTAPSMSFRCVNIT